MKPGLIKTLCGLDKGRWGTSLRSPLADVLIGRRNNLYRRCWLVTLLIDAAPGSPKVLGPVLHRGPGPQPVKGTSNKDFGTALLHMEPLLRAGGWASGRGLR